MDMAPEVYTIWTVCTHQERTDIGEASPTKLQPCPTDKPAPSKKQAIYLIIGWCKPCEIFLSSNASSDEDEDETSNQIVKNGISSNPLPPRNLIPVMQLWLWKTLKEHHEPVDLDVLPVGYLGPSGTHPEEMDDSILRTGRTSLQKIMKGIKPTEVNIIPPLKPFSHPALRRSASSTALGLGVMFPDSPARSLPCSHHEVLYMEASFRNLNRRTLNRIARRAQWWTLAWATGQDYLCREWRLRNLVPRGEIPMETVLGWEREEKEVSEGVSSEPETAHFEGHERSGSDEKSSAEVSPLSQMRHPLSEVGDISSLSLYERWSEYCSDDEERNGLEGFD